MEKTSTISLAVILLVQLGITGLFYKAEAKFAMLISFLLTLFSWSALLLLSAVINFNEIILLSLVFLIQGTGFLVFLKGSWQKAFLVSAVANAVSIGLVILLLKLFR